MRQARLVRKLIDGEIYRQDAELAGELATDVKLSSRPLTEISVMLLAWVLGWHFPTKNTDDMLASIVGWMPVPPTKAVLTRFLKQGFQWHPSSSDIDAAQQVVTTRSGWGEFDPRKAPPVVTLASTETRVHHQPIVVATQAACEQSVEVASTGHATGFEATRDKVEATRDEVASDKDGSDSSSEDPVE
mgnify:CR=1 FL=1